jgi:hypothetical protein
MYGGGCLAVVVVAALLIGVPLSWHSRWRYEIQYWLPDSRISIDTQPHDCDFLKSPLGSKECHYRRLVTTMRFARSAAGSPLVSYDSGKTWENFTPIPGMVVPQRSTVEGVIVSWNKVED